MSLNELFLSEVRLTEELEDDVSSVQRKRTKNSGWTDQRNDFIVIPSRKEHNSVRCVIRNNLSTNDILEAAQIGEDEDPISVWSTDVDVKRKSLSGKLLTDIMGLIDIAISIENDLFPDRREPKTDSGWGRHFMYMGLGRRGYEGFPPPSALHTALAWEWIFLYFRE